MKKLKNHGLLAAGLVLALAVGISALTSQSILQGHDSPQRLEGTWLLTVTRPDGSTFLSLHTYTASGGTIGTTNNAPGLTSPSHGNWVRTGNREFTNTFVIFRFDAARQFIGTVRVTLNIRLAQPDEFRSVHLVETFDADGNLIASRHDTAVGRRLEIVDFPNRP